MKKQSYMSWHTYFMSIALLSSFRSKDQKTQNGACIVDAHHKIIGIGYNGLPRGCSDDAPGYWDDNDADILHSKHTYVVHAEKNAIYNCTSPSIENALIYVTQFPCNTCAQAIIQVGIRQVIYLHKKKHHHEINTAVMKMFHDAKVSVTAYKKLAIDDHVFLERLSEMQHFYD